jgi:hypothetical protein
MVSVCTALGANRGAVQDPGTLWPKDRTALRASQDDRRLRLAPSRIRMTPAAFGSAVLTGSALERHAAPLTSSEGLSSPPLVIGTSPTYIGAEPCCFACGPEINPTPLAGSRFRRDNCGCRPEHLTWHTGHPWTAWALLRLEITLANSASGRSQSGEGLLTSLLEVIPNTHTLDLHHLRRTCAAR